MSDVHTILIDGIAHGGDGVGRLDGKAVFVPGALPGETVAVTLTENRARYARGRVVDIVVAAPERVDPPCPYVSRCGGCDLQHVSYSGQAALKRRVVVEQLQRLGKVENPNVRDVMQVTEPTGYRSQIRLHVTKAGALGFYAPSSHTVVPIDRCLVANPGVQQAQQTIGTAPGATDVTIRSLDSITAHVTVTPSGKKPDAFVNTISRLTAHDPARLTVNDTTSDQVVTVGAHAFHVPPDAFFQASVPAAAAITTEVIAACGLVADQQVADLYAGIGLFALPLAHHGADVTAVESHRAAADAARRNTSSYDVTVITDTVERFLASNHTRFDVVVLDPPRSGAGNMVIDSITRRGPSRIVYVACDPAALARDTYTLGVNGYALREAVPIDAFPMTHHIEVVATFVAAN